MAMPPGVRQGRIPAQLVHPLRLRAPLVDLRMPAVQPVRPLVRVHVVAQLEVQRRLEHARLEDEERLGRGELGYGREEDDGGADGVGDACADQRGQRGPQMRFPGRYLPLIF